MLLIIQVCWTNECLFSQEKLLEFLRTIKMELERLAKQSADLFDSTLGQPGLPDIDSGRGTSACVKLKSEGLAFLYHDHAVLAGALERFDDRGADLSINKIMVVYNKGQRIVRHSTASVDVCLGVGPKCFSTLKF